ncbi:SAM-dependent methyltransferase [Streptomyces bohaiensis]|uniref:SAM-dependent methyltransferase n=1 Tax=Streptomyces bohaiensis TaxID=1431344 RepID=UPI0035E3FCF3
MAALAPYRAAPHGGRLLDPYCCQGGAGVGYWLAGWEVTGVDLHPQPRYPLTFIQADAVQYIRDHGSKYDAIAGSPPCQRYSLTQRIQHRDHPDLIGPTREAMLATGKPWVIENVPEAAPELRDPVMLCGAAFGLRTYRHRLFETGGGFTLPQPEHAPHTHPTVKMGRPLADGEWYHAVGNFSNVTYVRDDMQVPWMSRDGIRECIPPAYTRWIGQHLAGETPPMPAAAPVAAGGQLEFAL